MIDTFRKLHPISKKFTRSNEIVKSRIDYIWISNKLRKGLLQCNIIEADNITNSDHSLVTAKLLTEIMKRVRSAACNRRLKSKQWHFQLDKATEANWEEYKANLEKLLKKKIERKKSLIGSQKTKLQNKDELWDLVSSSIIKCARSTLPGKKATLGRTNIRKKTNTSDKIKKDLKIIGNICHQCAVGMGQQINDMNRTNINLQITSLNSVYETEIEELSEEVWSKEKLEDLKTQWKIMYTKVQQARKKEDLEEINIAVEQYCKAIQGELKHIISSFLKRSFR